MPLMEETVVFLEVVTCLEAIKPLEVVQKAVILQEAERIQTSDQPSVVLLVVPLAIEVHDLWRSQNLLRSSHTICCCQRDELLTCQSIIVPSCA